MLIFWISFVVVGFIVASSVYVLARKWRLMALVDTIWTLGLGVSALAYHRYTELDSIRSWVVLLLIMVWSFRLSYHLFADRILLGKEDPRYRALAEYWGKQQARNFYFLFLAQVVLVALFFLPVSVAMRRAGVWTWLDLLGVGIAVCAMLGEALADQQLAQFRAQVNNKGAVCRRGLWRYSRHPNYFFEWLHWFGYLLLAAGAPLAWIGPIAMYVFLRYLTGVPFAERSSLKSRGQAYRRYQSTTNTFFPWIPRNQSN
ncbi:MAG TPA: hypothetical protein DEA90_15155 [Opitutae bacterium]|nr:hypothetical protein [Puniceicoccaceae bacterium]HBR95498.1 hypothetical protein [Opitutae bacterium]|tara:strand:- start:3213 stop:3986 length:774 start_codon:yes stop_codon:yes gene_type:complete